MCDSISSPEQVVADQPDDDRVYYWRDKPSFLCSLKPPKQGVKAVVKEGEEDFNRCWREFVSVLDMATKIKPDTLWPGEPAASYPPDWESRVLNLSLRMPELGSAAVVFTLQSCDGHAGQATKLLQQFWRYHSDLAGEDQEKRFRGTTSVAIELLHAITDIQALFQQGEYFKARKACEATRFQQKHEEIKVEFIKRQEAAHDLPDDEVVQRAMDEIEVSLLCCPAVACDDIVVPWTSVVTDGL